MLKDMKQKKNTSAKESKSPFDMALHFLGPKMRTIRETERHLDALHYGEYEVQQAVDRLQELGYLDDAGYAKEFVRTRLNTKPISRYKLQQQLQAHELPRDIIETALATISDEQESHHAQLIAEKYAPQIMHWPEHEREPRLIQRLTGRGFLYDDACRAARAALLTQDTRPTDQEEELHGTTAD